MENPACLSVEECRVHDYWQSGLDFIVSNITVGVCLLQSRKRGFRRPGAPFRVAQSKSSKAISYSIEQLLYDRRHDTASRSPILPVYANIKYRKSANHSYFDESLTFTESALGP